MKAALYARVSTRDKDQDPETQLVALREWALRQGAECEEFVDYASGKDLTHRDAWLRMMQRLGRRKLDTLAVVRLDRAFRSVIDMHATLGELEARGVRFVSITQPIDTGSSLGRFMLTVLAAVAELEREIIGERVREGLARARQQGKQLGRPMRLFCSDHPREHVEDGRCMECGNPGHPLSSDIAHAALLYHMSYRKAALALGVPVATLQRAVTRRARRIKNGIPRLN